MIGGLTGRYPSVFSAQTFSLTYVQYVEIEMRDLIEYPLFMTQTEKQRFVDFALSLFWEYSGSYKFLTNNCATETRHLFDFAYGLSSNIGVDTPTSVFDKLQSHGKIISSEIVTHQGQNGLQLFYNNLPFKSKLTLSEYLRLNPLDRQSYYSQLQGREIYFAMLVERAAQVLWAKRFSDQVSAFILDKNSPELQAKITKFNETVAARSLGKKLSYGYGIPQVDDFVRVDPSTIEKELPTLKQQLQISIPILTIAENYVNEIQKNIGVLAEKSANIK